MKNNSNEMKAYQAISILFSDLIAYLKKYRFDFCAYVVEDVYFLYSAEIEKRVDHDSSRNA